MLWDPSFATWQALGVRTNSSMMVLASDLSGGTNPVYGFDDSQRAAILDILPDLQVQ